MVEKNVPLKKVLLTKEQLDTKIKEMAKQISKDYAGKNPVFICVLRGAVLFFSDLMQNLNIKCSMDFIAPSSYSGNLESSGVVRLLLDLRENIKDRHVVLVEDIVDTGLTMNYLIENLKTRKPTSLEICTLLDKTENRKQPVPAKYIGFKIPNEFVVGYGLDYQEFYRNLPYVGVLDETKI